MAQTLPTPELTLQTPALLFPAISLLLLAYTNRYLHLAQLIRKLHADYQNKPDPIIIYQIGNLRHRIQLIRWMQTLGISSILGCTVAMFLLFQGWPGAAKNVFSFSLLLMIFSLVISLREIQLSGDALNYHLADLERKEGELMRGARRGALQDPSQTKDILGP